MSSYSPTLFKINMGSPKHHLKAITFSKSHANERLITPTKLKKLNFQTTPEKRIPRGIMQKTIQQRLEYYTKFQKERNIKRLFDSIGLRQNQTVSPLQQKPVINNRSQKLFKKLKQTRNLSPNLLKRFDEYQISKKEKILKMRVSSYMKQTGRKPKAQNFIDVRDQKEACQLNLIIEEVLNRDYSPLK